MPLIGGSLKPPHCLRIVLRNTLPVVVAETHIPLRLRISLLRELPQVVGSLGLRGGID